MDTCCLETVCVRPLRGEWVSPLTLPTLPTPSWTCSICIAFICSAEFGSQTNLFSVLQLQILIQLFHLIRHCRSTPFHQPLQVILKELSCTLTSHDQSAVGSLPTADRAYLLSVSSPHASLLAVSHAITGVGFTPSRIHQFISGGLVWTHLRGPMCILPWQCS